MRPRTTRRDFLRMMGAAAGVAVGATLPGILGGGIAVSGGFAVPAGAGDRATQAQIKVYSVEKGNHVMTQTVVKTKGGVEKNADARAVPRPAEEGDGAGFSGKYAHHEPGIYRCAGCGLDLSVRREVRFRDRMAQLHGAGRAENVRTRRDNSLFLSGSRCSAPGAADTLATCSTTGRSRPGCATA